MFKPMGRSTVLETVLDMVGVASSLEASKVVGLDPSRSPRCHCCRCPRSPRRPLQLRPRNDQTSVARQLRKLHQQQPGGRQAEPDCNMVKCPICPPSFNISKVSRMWRISTGDGETDDMKRKKTSPGNLSTGKFSPNTDFQDTNQKIFSILYLVHNVAI